jgi:hypothetical protein
MGFSHIDHFGLKPIWFLFYFIPLAKAKRQEIVLYKNQHVFELKNKNRPEFQNGFQLFYIGLIFFSPTPSGRSARLKDKVGQGGATF